MTLTRMELKNLRALQTKKGRRAQGRFLAEGVRLLEEAVAGRHTPEIVYFAPALVSKRGEGLVEQFRGLRVPVHRITARHLEQVSDTRTPQGIIAVFTIPDSDPLKLYTPADRKILVCENISDPGNLGTLLRSALAFDFRMVLLAGDCAEPFSPKVVRSSVGAVFGLKIAEGTVSDVKKIARAEPHAVLATTLGGVRHDDWLKRLTRHNRSLLLIGSEAEGLSKRMLELADTRVRIEHSSRVESLNAAIAGSIIMKQVYDLSRQGKPDAS